MEKKRKETREEIISRVSKEYNISPKNTGGTVIASSVGSPSTYQKAGSKAQQKAQNESIAKRVAESYAQRKREAGIRDGKWYSGDRPTASETVARMYQRAAGDEGHFRALADLYDQEISNPGSIIYNPYTQATNTKAIDGLRELGVDVPEVISDQWIDGMWREYSQDGRQTTTGYGPSAPTTKSTRENDIAYWVNTLLEDKENTSLAEAQMKSLYDEVAYLTGQGYSDNEILKRVRHEFGNKYNVLNGMDEARIAGDAVRLNRAVNYNGDDTIYGMIWAARNGGGSGDYFTDAVRYAMGQGNRYKADPESEAALDPSNYEGYSPYARGGTMHEYNMQYGVKEFTGEWLEANRGMLNDPEQADTWRRIEKGIKTADQAAKEKAALDQWVEKQIAGGNMDAEDMEAAIRAAMAGEDEFAYTYTDPKTGKEETEYLALKTLAAMEEKRASGDYLELGYAVDFALPQYLSGIEDRISGRDAEIMQNAEAENTGFDFDAAKKGFTDWVQGVGGEVNRFLASMGIDGIGSYGQAIDSMLEAQHGAKDAGEIARNYAASMGISIKGDLTANEIALVEDAMAKVEAAIQPKATQEQREDANLSIAMLQEMINFISSDPNRIESYKDEAAYTSVFEREPEEMREGMAEMIAEPTAYEEGAYPGRSEDTPTEAEQAYMGMLEGSGEWNAPAFSWALGQSDNPAAVWAELGDGILGLMSGRRAGALANSWYDRHKGLTANINQMVRPSGMRQGESEAYRNNPERFDSRYAYGQQVYDVIMLNEQALQEGAIYPSQYADNLIYISGVADAMQDMVGEGRITDAQAAEMLAMNGGELGNYLGNVQAGLDAAMKTVANKRAAEEELAQNRVRIIMSKQYKGLALSPDEQQIYDAMMAMDVHEAARADAAYRDMSAQMRSDMSAEAVMQGGMQFTTGSAEADMSIDSATLQQSGAQAYSQGVLSIAQEALDKEMRTAAAYGYSLGEYYEKYPERARTSGQLLDEAESEYRRIWNDDFGGTIAGLLETNAILGEQEEEAETRNKDTLSMADIFGLATQKFGWTTELSAQKAKNFAFYTWADDEAKINSIRQQYGNDPAAYAADLDEWEKSREEKLRSTYDYDAEAKQKGISYEDWVKAHPDALYEQEKAARQANVDIFRMGVTPAELDNMQQISDLSGTIANVDEFVAQNGSEMDNLAYGLITSIENTVTLMGGTALGGGTYLASAVSMLPDAGANAYDRYQKSGNWSAALWASFAELLVNAGIEKVGYDRIMPEGLGGNLEKMMAHADYVLAEMGFAQAIKSQSGLAKLAKGIAAQAVKGAFDAGSEALEELSQSLVTSLADNATYGTPYLLSRDQIKDALKDGAMGAMMAVVLSVATSGGRNHFSDEMGNAVSAAEAQLLPEAAGEKLNMAIDFEATTIALHQSQQELAQVEASSENQAAKQAGAELEEAKAALAEAEGELEQAQAERENAAVALEDVEVERQDSDVFTEDMRKRMVAAAEAVQKAGEAYNKVRDKVQAAQARAAEAQAKFDEASAKVRQMYNDVMDRAKAAAEKLIVDKLFSGDDGRKRAAADKYRAACRKVVEAKNALRSARADLALAKRGTASGEAAQLAYGEALLEVEGLLKEVDEAKAEMEAAYAETAESKAQSAGTEALAKAQETAQQAADEAAADPMNMRKQRAADAAQAQLEVVEAQQEMEAQRASVAEGLKSADEKARNEALETWKGLNQKLNDALESAKTAQSEYDATDMQRQLQEAIDEANQYTNEQLLFDMEEGHSSAVQAYKRLQLAKADAEVENAMNAVNAAQKGSAEHDAAITAYNAAVEAREDEIGRQMGTTGDAVREMLSKGPAGAQVLEAVQQGDKRRAADLIRQIMESDAKRRAELAAKATRTLSAFRLLPDMETGAKGKAGVTHSYSRKAKKAMNSDSRLQLKVLDVLAKDSGFEVVMKDTLSNVKGAVNGVLSRGGTIYVGLDAIEQGYLQAGTHEIVHGIARRSKAAFDELKQTVAGILKEKGLDIAKMAQDRMADYAARGQKLNEEGAMEEIVAESAAQIWASEENLKKFADEHPNAFKRVYDAFVKFWQKIRDISSRIAQKNDRREIAAMLSDDGALQKVYDTFMKVAKEAGVEAEVQQEQGKFSLNNLDGDEQIDYTAGINADGGIQNDRILQGTGRKGSGGSDGRRIRGASGRAIQATRRIISTELPGRAAVYLDRGTDQGLVTKGKPGYNAYLNAVKGSKISDKNGRPIVLYHGTRATFKQFGKGQRNFSNTVGYYFSSSALIAERYAGTSNQNGEAVLHPVAINAKNPLTLNASQFNQDYKAQNNALRVIERARRNRNKPGFNEKLMKAAYNPNNGVPASVAEAIVKAFRENGDIDCLIVKGCTWDFDGAKPNDQYVVFDSRQIVPATEQYWAEWAEKNSTNDFSLNESAWNGEIANDLAEQLATNTGNAMEIADILGRIDGDMWRDHRASGKTGETTTADRNPIEILSRLTRSIRAGYNPGGSMAIGNTRLTRDVLGFYDRYARSITTRTSEAGDLVIGLHEFGHAVQARMPNLHANQQMLNGLSQDVRNAYNRNEWDGEAIAEFVVAYIFNRSEAARQAGDQFVQDFEDMLRADRPLYDAIMEASHQTELWNNADIGSRVGAMVQDSIDPRRRELGGRISRMLRGIETSIFDATAPADLVSRNFRRQALYSMQGSKRSDTVLTRRLIDPRTNQQIGLSLAERLYNAGVQEQDMNDIVRYALARHALDRRAQGKDVFDEHEFPTAELRRLVADMEASRPNIVAGADAITEFWNDFADAWLVGTGMIDRATIERMRAMYPHYVPTFRVMDENYKQYGGKSARFTLRAAVRGGSSLEVINPMVSIVSQVQKVVNAVTQNQLMQAFHAEMQRGGMGEIATYVPERLAVQRNDISRAMAAIQQIRQSGNADPDTVQTLIDEINGLGMRFVGTRTGSGRNTVSGVDEFGRRFYYDIHDAGLFNLLAGNTYSASIVPEGLRKFNRAFTALTTGSNPLFAIKNAQRDIQASVNTGTWALTYADGMAKWLWALAEVMTGSESFRQWQAMGGGEHNRISTTLTKKEAGELTREVGRMLLRGRRGAGGRFRTRKGRLDQIVQTISFAGLNNAIENASRFAEWRFGRHDLTTEEGRMEAYMRSQDVTVNFGTIGASGFIQNLARVVPFMNASLQGLNKDINIVKDLFSRDSAVRAEAIPKAGKTLMNAALTAAVQMLMLKMFGGSDDDDDYALLNDEMKMGNLIIPIPKNIFKAIQDATGFNKPYLRIPIAQGPMNMGAYALMLDMMANVADYSPMEISLWGAAKSLFADSLPDGTVFQGLMDAMNNRTWYGGEIENYYMQQGSWYNRYDEEVPTATIRLARFLRVSPAKLDYVLNQYTGIIGKLAAPMMAGGSLEERGDRLVNSLLGNYTVDPVTTNDLTGDYKSAKTIISETIYDGKNGQPMGHIAYGADAGEAYAAAKHMQNTFSRIDKELKNLWAEYNEINADPTMGDGDKSRRMRRIREEQINPLYQEALAEFDEFRLLYMDMDPIAMEVYAFKDLIGLGERPDMN